MFNRRDALKLGAGMLAKSAFAGAVSSPVSFIRGLGVNYILSVGQSLSIGFNSGSSLSTTQPYTNRKWVGGIIYPTNLASFVPLIEAGGIETHCSGFANQVSAWVRAVTPGSTLQDTVMASWGVAGTAYSGLKKGTAPYTDSMAGITAANALGLINVPSVLSVHGEANAGDPGYSADLVQWQTDYQSDIKAVTRQPGIIPLFCSQATTGGGDWTGGMLNAFEANPTTVVLMGPKYIVPYNADATHLTPAGYRWMGEMYAKAYYKQIILGQQWSPLRPTNISISGPTITIQFTGFVAPLVFDTTTLPNRGNMGFEWSGSETISSVVLTDATTGVVTITLSGTPVLTTQRLRYAYTATTATTNNSTRWGNLRDSDTTVSLNGNALQNWCCHLDKPYSFTSP